jgi:hypothetical protein
MAVAQVTRFRSRLISPEQGRVEVHVVKESAVCEGLFLLIRLHHFHACIIG